MTRLLTLLPIDESFNSVNTRYGDLPLHQIVLERTPCDVGLTDDKEVSCQSPC